MRESNLAYYERRIVECEKLAETASDPHIARLHRNYADQYRRSAEEERRQAEAKSNIEASR